MSSLPFYRDTWAEINLDHLKYNIQSFVNYLPNQTKMMAIVKANGYGHGALYIAKKAVECGAKYLGVALLEEAVSLRNGGIKDIPILVLGVTTKPEDVMVAIKHNITLTVTNKDWLIKAREYINPNCSLKLHLKIDTGMGRIGIRDEKEAIIVIEEIKRDKAFLLDGVYTHFATADEKDNLYYNLQVHRFQQILKNIGLLESKSIVIHAANSAATLKDTHNLFDVCRVGISLYGLAPSKEMKNNLPFPLKEVFSLHSKVVYVKKIEKGEKVSYGATYTAEHDEWIGTVPIGYADGWIRKLGNGTQVLVDGKRVPIVGRVCMDQLMIRLPKQVPENTLVTFIGQQEGNEISIDEVADRLETINYEIPIMISSRVPRIFIENGKRVAMYLENKYVSV